MATVAACGGSSGNGATTTQTVAATTTQPTKATGSVAVAGNAPYWAWKLTKQDPDLKQFADYVASDWCKKPEIARSLDVSTQVLPIEYGFYRQKMGKPTTTAAWADDVETKALIAAYIESTYCPAKD